MGEVYRADDLTLGQAVAMKFLPEQATSNEAMLGRFKNEVRIARRVSHPNVCRVYDVGEVDGATFFTMEWNTPLRKRSNKGAERSVAWHD